MNMNKKIITLTMAVILVGSLLSGCSKGNNTNPLDFSNTTLTGTVTSVNNKKITLSLAGGGRMTGGSFDGASPEQSFGDKENTPNQPDSSESESNDQAPSELPDTEDSSQISPRQSENGTKNNKDRAQPFAGNTTFTLTITDESVFQNASLSDVTEGSLLTITFGDNNTITSISVTVMSDMENGDSVAQNLTK